MFFLSWPTRSLCSISGMRQIKNWNLVKASMSSTLIRQPIKTRIFNFNRSLDGALLIKLKFDCAKYGALSKTG